MYKNIQSILYLFILFSTVLVARYNYNDVGISGSIGYSYNYNVYNTNDIKSTKTNFTQNYKIGYDGSIYSPNLLSYKLLGGLDYLTDTSSTYGNDSTSKINGSTYGTRMRFIKKTRLPFTISYTKTQRPLTVKSNGETISYDTDMTNKAIYGNIKLGFVVLNYSYSLSETTSKAISEISSNNTEMYNMSVSKKLDDQDISVNYTHNNRELLKDDLIKDESTSSLVSDDNLRLMYNWDISKDLTFKNKARYIYNDSLLSESMTMTSSLSWYPKTKYSASISVNVSASNSYGYLNNDLKLDRITIDSSQSIAISQSLRYRMTENINLTQSSNYSKFGSTLSDGENIVLRLGSNFNKIIFTDISLNLLANTSTSVSKNTYIIDNNISDSTISNSSISFAGSMSKNISLIASRVYTSVNYNVNSDSLNLGSKIYGTNLVLKTDIFGILDNSLSARYNESSSKFVDSKNRVTTRSISNFSLGERVSINSRINIRGNISTSASILYSKIYNNNDTITRILPTTNIVLMYNFFGSFKSNAGASVSSDLIYDTINYSAYSGLGFSSGKTSVSMDYAYSKTTYKVNAITTNRDRHNFNAKIQRYF